MLRLIIGLWFTLFTLCNSAFIQTRGCASNFPESLAPFIVDVKLVNKKLLFLISSKVLSPIDDVNLSTNTYSTMLVKIDFMGTPVIDEHLRFCEFVAVKNTLGGDGDAETSIGNADLQQMDDLLEKPLDTGLEGGLLKIGPRGAMFNEFKGEIESVLPPGLGLPGVSLELGNDISGMGFKENSVFDDFEVNNRKGSDFYTYSTRENEDQIDLDANTTVSVPDFFKNLTGQLKQCPLQTNDSILIYYEADISDHFYRFGSYSVSFTVISNTKSEIIGCARMSVTPIQPQGGLDTILYGVIVLLTVTYLINFFTVVNSSYQESSNPFLYKASTFCNTKLLKQLDANVTRIIVYLQFALFIGGLDLQYPGYYQPLISQLRWAALLGPTFIGPNNYFNRTQTIPNPSGVYNTFRSGGLKSLTNFTYQTPNYQIWSNFIICFGIWLVLQSAAHEFLLLAKFTGDYLAKRFFGKNILNDSGNLTVLNNFHYILGQILHSILHLFSFPILVFTSYIFETTARTFNKVFFIPSLAKMQDYAFSFTTPYDAIDASECGRKSASKTENITFNYSSICRSAKVNGIPVYQPILAAIVFALWFSICFYFIFHYLIRVEWLKIRRSRRISKLYTSMRTILLWSFLYDSLHPDKVWYAGVDLLFIAVKAIIIGVLQNNGLIQVILLVVFEFVEVLTLFVTKPYFVQLSWTSSRCWIPIAKVVVTILCIPYIRNLDIGERTRTYVSYAQLLIHVVVALIFILQLVYCLAVTIISIFDRKRAKKATDSNDDNGVVIFSKYEPLSCNIEKAQAQSLDDDDDDEDITRTDLEYYYRGRSGNQLGDKLTMQDYDLTVGHYSSDFTKLPSLKSQADIELKVMSSDLTPSASSIGLPISDAISVGDSFTGEEQVSQLRRQNTNYCVREGDNVFKKYFTDDTIDPEVKALWKSRNSWKSSPKPQVNVGFKLRKNAEKLLSKSMFTKLPVESGFHVSRPKQLIIQPTQQQGKISSQDSSSLTSSH